MSMVVSGHKFHDLNPLKFMMIGMMQIDMEPSPDELLKWLRGFLNWKIVTQCLPLDVTM